MPSCWLRPSWTPRRSESSTAATRFAFTHGSARRDRIESQARERLGLPLDLAEEGGYTAVDARLSPSLALAAALDELPDHERDALELRVIGELPYQERIESRRATSEQLERAVERDRRAGSRRHMTIRMIAATAGAVAITIGVASPPGDDTTVSPPGVPTASAAQRAAAVLSSAPGAIVHEVATYRQVGPDGSVSDWREERWRQTSRPYARRELTTRDGGTVIETATVGERATRLYDRAARTIYTNPPQDGPALGTPMPATDGDPLREQLVQLLRSADPHTVTRSTVGARGVLRFAYENTLPDGGAVDWTYVVDAETYQRRGPAPTTVVLLAIALRVRRDRCEGCSSTSSKNAVGAGER